MMKRLACTTVLVLLLTAGAAGLQGEADAAERYFLHLSANFKEDDGPVCVAFNVAWRALLDGDEVELFFDQDAAYGIKQWEPGKTDLGLYPLPERIVELLAETFGVDPGSLPANYQEYLGRLHEAGARVTVNGFWNALTGVETTVRGREWILPYVEPLTLAQVLEHRSRATVYLRF